MGSIELGLCSSDELPVAGGDRGSSCDQEVLERRWPSPEEHCLPGTEL